MKAPLYQKIKNLSFILMIVLTLTYFLSEFEYINPIPYNETLFWLTLVSWSTLNLYSLIKKKKV